MSAKEIAHLAERWPTMTPREKDAEVALAKGLEVWHEQGEVIGGRYGTLEVVSGLEGPLPHYSTSWSDVGLLMEELASIATGGLLLTSSGSAGPWLLHIDGPDGVLVSEEGPTIPDVVALAYCIAKGAAPSIGKP